LIEQQTTYRFIYSTQIVPLQNGVSIQVKDRDVTEVLKQLLNGLNLIFIEKIGKVIVIYRDGKDTVQKDIIESLPPVGGKILDENGTPLQGASIQVKGTNIGTISDANGLFSINVPSPKSVLFISYSGFLSQEIAVGSRSVINITLQPNQKSLNEVVVVGYGTVKKSDLTGSVSKVSEAAIKATPIVALDRALQGRAPGVLVTQTSARPGGVAAVRIRGAGSISAGNEPLYVIDGFPTTDLNSINPGDIESLEILKDASATAIYGSRGSNGVVIVTTKRGKAGQSSVDVESYYGVQNNRRKIPLLNASQYADFINEARLNGGGTAYFDGSSADRPLPTALTTDTDWQNEVFRSAPIQSHQITLSGGESKTRYAISGNYYDQQGIVQNSYFKRYTLRTNLDREVASWLKVGLSMQAAHTRSNAARTETEGGANSGVTNSALNFAPVFPVYQPDGRFYRDLSPLNGNNVDNPVGLSSQLTDLNFTSRVLASFFADVTLAKGLTFRTNWGADLIGTRRNFYVTRQIGLGAGTNGSALISSGQYINWLNENTLTYSRTLGEKHNLTALLGYTSQAFRQEDVSALAANFIDDFGQYNNLGAGTTLQRPSSGTVEWAMISYLARLNYGFSDRYLFTLTARQDGSSRFGPARKYGFFPSGAFAWRVINEPFLKNQKLLSDLKLRASYGLTGNQEIGNYRFLSSIAVTASTAYPFGAPPVQRNGAAPNGISNLELGWEKNAQADFGVDIGVFNNRIQLTADYYVKTTSDLLFNVNVPLTTGYGTSLRNIGRVENRGLELGLNTINVTGGNFSWSSEINVAFNRNKVLSLDGRPAILTGDGSTHLNVQNIVQLAVGEPLGNFYGRVVEGIFQNQNEIDGSAQKTARPGDFRFADLNGDGQINDDDRQVIGNGYPSLFGGINNTFRYKGLELTAFFQGVTGNDILNFGRFDLYNLNGNNNQSADVLNRWTPTNPSTVLPRATTAGGQRILSTFHIEDGSYLRLKNISLGYNLPRALIGKAGLKSAKVYVSAQNYLTFTKYSGYDPEVSRSGAGSISQGTDYGGYPTAKTLLVGLNLKF